MLALLGTIAGSVVSAQIVPGMPSLPGGGLSLPMARGLPGALADTVADPVRTTAQALARVHDATIARLVRDHPREIARDPQGFPARAGEVVIDAPDEAVLTAAAARGYAVIARDEVLGVGFARLRVPDGRSLRAAIDELRGLGATTTADQLYLPSGVGTASVAPRAGRAPSGSGPLVGVIDGGVPGATLAAGFAAGAPRANDHAAAVASLIGGAPGVRAALPGARIASADVYGDDPAGGNATAIARAIGWLVQQKVSVATISLVGPANPVLGRVIAAAQARGLIVVAAVGNAGPAAPPAYPASYPDVVAVTGVDGRNRPLIEAGRATHLDYAAPGADMLAAKAAGGTIAVRGTSFAAPLVAGTIARAYPTLAPAAMQGALAAVDRTARHAGPARQFGRGLLCGDCRTPAR
jgi:Subtilase family